MAIAVIAIAGLMRCLTWQEVHELCEVRLTEFHRRFRRTRNRKAALPEIRRSNRRRQKTPPTAALVPGYKRMGITLTGHYWLCAQ